MKSIKSLQTKKLHIKDEGGVWGNNPRMAFITIGKIRWTGQLCALADTHLKVTQNIGMNYLYFYHWNINPRQSGFGSSLLRYYLNFFKLKKCLPMIFLSRQNTITHLRNTFLPATDHFLFTNLELKWLVTVTGRVKLSSICQRAWRFERKRTRPWKTGNEVRTSDK